MAIGLRFCLTWMATPTHWVAALMLSLDRSEVEVILSPGAGSNPTVIPEQAVSFLASVSHRGKGLKELSWTDRKHFWLCKAYSLCHNYSLLLLCGETAIANNWVLLCFNKTLFTNTGGGPHLACGP